MLKRSLISALFNKTQANSSIPVHNLAGYLMIRYLRLRLSMTFKSVSTALLSHAGLGHIGKEGTSRVATTRGLPYQANGLFCNLGGLLMSPPLEDCLTGLRALLPGLEQVAQIYSLSVAMRHRHCNLTVLTGLCWQETKLVGVPGKTEIEAAWPKPSFS